MHAIELAREAGGDLAHEGADEVRPWRRGSHGRREGRGGEGKGRLATGWRMARDAHATVSVTSLIPFFFASGSHGTEVEGINTARKRGWGGALLPPSHNILT